MLKLTNLYLIRR